MWPSYCLHVVVCFRRSFDVASMPDRGTSNLKLRGRRRLSDRACSRRGPVFNQSNQSNQSRCRFLAGLPPNLPRTRGDPEATELGELGTVYRVAQSWVEVWIGPSVESGSAMGWADVTRSRRRPGTCCRLTCRACAHAVASNEAPITSSQAPRPAGPAGTAGTGRAAACGRGKVRPWGPPPSAGAASALTDCAQYSIFVSRNRFIASPAASDPYAGREPVALCCTRKPRGILGRVGYADAWDRSCGSACHFVGHWEHHTIPPKGAWDIICRKGPEIAKPTRNMTSPPRGARLHV